MEKTEIEGMVIHTACFRCAKCNCKLTPAKFSRTPAGVFYCPTHYQELFRLRGKYDQDASAVGKGADVKAEGGGSVSAPERKAPAEKEEPAPAAEEPAPAHEEAPPAEEEAPPAEEEAPPAEEEAPPAEE